MNPFALHGPQFLAFYAAVGVMALGLQYFWTRILEARATMPPPQMTDPYQIAYLRGGAGEALRLVAFSLLDRGLLTGGSRTLRAEAGADALVRRRIEKAVLSVYRVPGAAAEMESDARCRDACQEYDQKLQDYGLIAGAQISMRRLVPFLVLGMAVMFVGLLKLFIAFSEGRHNVGFLILLMAGFGFGAFQLFRRHRTKLGDDMLADLRAMFARLRDRSHRLGQGGATNEAALLAAVFGFDALSPARFPGLRALKPQKAKRKSNGSSCGSDCGSSWSWGSSSSSCGSSSSSDSSGGSSCGSSCGGGCGGGCGG